MTGRQGAVAAGSPGTARAGVAAFERGGNAVDAAVAACLATAATEPVLTSLAGGGAMLVRDGRTGRVDAWEFFADAPGRGLGPPAGLDFRPVDVDFGPTTQRFHVGAGSAAVPGVIPGLLGALERWGRLDPADAVAPACRMLRRGVPLDPFQVAIYRLLAPILRQTPEVRDAFLDHGAVPEPGRLFRLPRAAGFLERLARDGWERVARGEVWPAVEAGFGPAAGGRITRRDLEAYAPRLREPLVVGYRGHRVYLNPPPAAGGWMVALMLRVLAAEAPLGRPDPFGPDHVLAVARALAVADEARASGAGAGAVAEPGPWIERFRALEGRPLAAPAPAPGGPPSTTHVSAVDAEGGAAAVTFTYGEGCGRFVGDTGVMMNNLMGEADLFPDGFHRWPAGERLSTMMCPALVAGPDGALTVLGTGGANRIRSAVVQAVTGLVDLGLPPEDVVAAPRIHYEDGVLNAEAHGRPGNGAFLHHLGARRVVLFPGPDLFFGGVHLVHRTPDGALHGAGDPRRGGTFRGT